MGARPVSQPDALTCVIAALPAEARTARSLGRIGWRIKAAGVGPERARAAAEALLDAGAERLLVWGTAGALQRDLRPGALIVAGEVLDNAGARYPVTEVWHEQLLECAPPGRELSTGALITVDRPVPDSHAKANLARQTGAVAVDMETAVVARLAQDHGVPFAVVRAIVDPLEQALPQAVFQAAPGRYPGLGVTLRLARRPRDLSGVIALGQNMRVARRSLSATARRLAEAAD